MIYKASLDKVARIVTLSVSILFFAIIFGQFYFTNDDQNAAGYIISFLLLIIYFGTYLFSPVGYQVIPGYLVILRPIKNKMISLDQIQSVELLPRGKLSRSWRTFGVGGLFGYYGMFRNAALRNMTWYATNLREETVLIRTNLNKKIILTPDEKEKFVRELQNHLLK